MKEKERTIKKKQSNLNRSCSWIHRHGEEELWREFVFNIRCLVGNRALRKRSTGDLLLRRPRTGSLWRIGRLRHPEKVVSRMLTSLNKLIHETAMSGVKSLLHRVPLNQ